ncbi:hypothetical protein [Streptomyces sp. NPDC088258]|uniref:hypothetical protein n=1 Tax=Streptomyces sp. NPDC088258 TaxID=3365849 RepID=UPI0038230852
MADEAAELYDPEVDRRIEYALDAADEEHGAAEAVRSGHRDVHGILADGRTS